MDEITQYITKRRRPSCRGKSETDPQEKPEPHPRGLHPRGLGRRKGVLVAKKVDGVPIVAWSLCNENDEFNRAVALKIAHTRINSVASQLNAEDEERRDDHVPIPHTVQKYLDEFLDRCKRYFKSNDDPKVFGRVMTEKEADEARRRDRLNRNKGREDTDE